MVGYDHPLARGTEMRVTIRKLKHNRGWVISSGIEWRVEAPTFADAAREARHYGMMYECSLDVEAAINRKQKRYPDA